MGNACSMLEMVSTGPAYLTLGSHSCRRDNLGCDDGLAQDAAIEDVGDDRELGEFGHGVGDIKNTISLTIPIRPSHFLSHPQPIENPCISRRTACGIGTSVLFCRKALREQGAKRMPAIEWRLHADSSIGNPTTWKGAYT